MVFCVACFDAVYVFLRELAHVVLLFGVSCPSEEISEEDESCLCDSCCKFLTLQMNCRSPVDVSVLADGGLRHALLWVSLDLDGAPRVERVGIGQGVSGAFVSRKGPSAALHCQGWINAGNGPHRPHAPHGGAHEKRAAHSPKMRSGPCLLLCWQGGVSRSGEKNSLSAKKALTPMGFLSTVQALPNVETARANKLGSLPEEEEKLILCPSRRTLASQYPGGVPAVAGEPLRGDAKRSNSRGKNCHRTLSPVSARGIAFRNTYNRR